ncbi:Catenin-beta-like protein [Phlebopus sp. FC_14]|nr:Catenin-beta-like protein [Phlebopus sp. FC_14]
MDVDKLFKVPKLPAGSKRKLPESPTPEMLKKMKFDDQGRQRTEPDLAVGHGNTTQSRVEDDAGLFNSTFAPGGDADYYVEEDEEGRFFGGGLTSEQKQILSIFESAEGEGAQDEPEEVTIASIRRTLLRFERAVNKNQDQRSKHPDDPAKFIDSEADLDSAIKSLLPLAQSPTLSYPEIVRSGSISLFIGLLSHENIDIVIDVVEVFHELTDEDVGNEEAVDGQEDAQGSLKILIEALVQNSILELLVDNLPRLNEAEESDRQGIFHILGVFENVIGFNPAFSVQLVSKTKIMHWLLQRIQSKTHDENRGYAAELLSIVLQNSVANRIKLGRDDGVEIILRVLSQFRRRDPVDADEAEFMENLFDTLCSALSEPENKSLFLASEGVDLMVLMMKEKLQSKLRSIKTLDYAMSGSAGANVCSNFVDVLGLKTLFSAFMSKTPKKKGAISTGSEDNAHILGIMSSLFSNLPSDSTDRIRLLAKFVENNYEKTDKLLEVRENTSRRLKTVDVEIEVEKKEMLAHGEIGTEDEDLWYLRRLDGGLFTLQTIDYILAWISMEDDGVRGHVTQMLQRKNSSLEDIIRTLQVYHDNVDGDDSSMGASAGPPAEVTRKYILQNLIAFLQGCM